ncbi:MAG: hypothetical protein HY423_04520 [Candidatus Lambdaproteobacteria bacterium]|nr:hypothetical protein [Candidatus Lambdaproteobacteria bacterium]
MRIEYGYTDLVLTSHAGLPAFAEVLQAGRLGGRSGSASSNSRSELVFVKVDSCRINGRGSDANDQ